MDLGATLRNARESRGLSVEGLARATKIQADLLRAIEANDFARVPGGIFLRGFLRSYAREVGLDPESVVQWYAREFVAPDAVAVREPTAAEIDAPPSAVHKPAGGLFVRAPRNGQWAAIALLAVAVIGYRAIAPRLSGPAARSAQGASPAGGAAQTAPALAAGAGSSAPAVTGAVATAGNALQIDIAAEGPCWVAATSDGERLIYGLLQPGDHRTFQVHDGLVLRVGDPGAFTYAINGVPGRPLGNPAEPMTLTITRDNFRNFLGAATRTAR